jgi:alkylation response protein AidB-like acyl-CoA dehydrogenase
VRLLVWGAAWAASHNLPFAKYASMARLKAGDVAMRVTEDAIWILGGYGYIRDCRWRSGTATPRSTSSGKAPRKFSDW